MRLIPRYLLREMIGPTLIGFSFYTFIIMMRQLLDLAEMIIKRSLPLTTVAELLLLSLPHVVVLTIPMSLLFGILIAIGRLSTDSEITAMRASGISARIIYRPVFYFSFAIFLLNLYLMNVVLPWGNSELQNLKADLFDAAIQKEIKPRVFYDEYEDMVIYVDDVDPATGRWKGVFVSLTKGIFGGSEEGGRQNIITAPQGQLIREDGSHSKVWLELEGAENHVFDPGDTERYDLNRNALQRLTPTDRFDSRPRRLSLTKSVREMNMVELIEELEISRARDPVDYRLTLIEIHKKVAIPFACIAFGLIGLPLGITSRRAGRSSGFSISIAIILLYYLVLSNGEKVARAGDLPPGLAMWFPNAVMVVLGIWLLGRANRDSGGGNSGVFARIKALVVKLKSRRDRKRAVVEAADDAAAAIARLDIAFPNLIDRYVLGQFGRVLLLVLISCAVLFVIVDYTERVDDIQANQISFDVVASYYRYLIIQIVNLITPLVVLISTLVVFGIFSRNSEITAIKANGISLYRITLPIIVVALFLSLGSSLLAEFVLPYSNDRLTELQDQIMGRETARTFTPNQRQWVFGKGRYLFNFFSYDSRSRALAQVQVFEFHPDEFRIARRIWAEEARYDGVGWVFVNGWMRSFADDGTSSFTRIVNPVRLHYPERPEYFENEAKSPSQMTFGELRSYISDIRRSGYAADPLLVDLWGKTSWPFVNLVMALIALPFAFRIGKKGTLYGIGVALMLAFLYWGLFGIFTKLGEVGSLPPVLAAWSANALFAMAAIYMFLRVET